MTTVKLNPRTKASKKRRLGPLILPSAIEAFLGRELDDFDWMKTAPADELLALLIDLCPRFEFHTDPFHHQLACLVIGLCVREFLFLLDMGAGKTKVILDLFYARWLLKEADRLLVLVPSSTNVEGWGDEIDLHRPELKYVKLIGSRQTRERLLEAEDAQVFLCNYEGLQSFMTHLVKKHGRVIDRRLAHSFAELFPMVAMDESHLIGNPNSLRYRMCEYVSKHAAYRYATTGTPFGRSPEKLWSQFFLVDHGATLATTLGMFRACYFIAKENHFSGWPDYKFDRAKDELLHRTLKHRSIRYEDTEFTDVPPIVYKQHRVSFSVEADKYYQQVLEQVRARRSTVQEMDNAFMRMRQVCAGFLALKADDDSRIEVQFYENPKLEELETILDVVGDEKLIIFHEWTRSADMVCELLERKKIRYCRMRGGDAKKAIEAKNQFERNSKVKVGVFNAHMVAGLNPQYVCRRAVFYESPSDPITREQCERRLKRTGQKRRVYIHDLIVARSIEERILKMLKEGVDLKQAILKGREKL